MTVHSGEPLDLADYWREAFEERADELDRLNAQALELCAEISGLRRENERLRETLNRYIKGVGDLATLAVQPKPVRFSLDEEYDDPPATSDQQSVGS